jgi:glucosamine kinase
MNDLVIGIDGGGSRTRACLANLHGETLGTGEAGTSNPAGGGLDAAKRELAHAVQRAFDAARLEPQRASRSRASVSVGGAHLASKRRSQVGERKDG